MGKKPHDVTGALRLRVKRLQTRLDEAEDTLRAIRAGEADSLIIESPDGPKVYAIAGVDQAYRTFVEVMNEGAASLGKDGIIHYCNARFAAMLEAPLSQVMGRSIKTFVPAAHAPAFRALVRQATRGESRGELGLSTLGGRTIPVLISLSTIRERGRRVLCLLATDARASALTAAQQQADSERKRLETVMELLPVGVAITDASGGNVQANAALAQIWRMHQRTTNAAGYQSQRAWEVETGKPVLPDDWASIRARKTGKPIIGQLLQIERCDGSRGYVIHSAAPIRDAKGQVTGSVAAVQDVTDLQNELTARKRGARLYAMLSRANEAITRCRDEGPLHDQVCRILAEIGGYPLAWIGLVKNRQIVPAAASGPAATCLEGVVVALDDQPGTHPAATAVREQRPVFNQDVQVDPLASRALASNHGLCSSAAFPLWRDGAVVAVLTVYARESATFDDEHRQLLEALAADVSFAQDALEDERRRSMAEQSLARSEASLRDATERKNKFLAVLSHELRNPLAAIKNSLYILRLAPPAGEQAARATAVIERQVAQLARLVDDLLDVTRLTRGKLRLEKARFELVEAVRRTVDDHRPLFEQVGLLLETAMVEPPMWIDGDAARLAQMVGNLLTNAAKFTLRGGKVTLSIRREGPATAAIRVRDTGVGISADLLPHLFEPFMQADNTLDRSKGGLGLGLTLVKGVVDMHGGSVEARSAGLDQGAEFIIRLPILAVPEVPCAPKDAVAPLQDATLRRRVLIIEDHEDAAHTLRDVLTLARHHVELASNGPEGIRKARAFRPDVVICDIGLPGMSGYEVARFFRGDADLCSTFLIALSGYAQPEDVRRSAEAGFETHLAKPPNIERLQEILLQPRPSRALRQ